MVSHIVAASENNIIGTDKKLPWNIPEDMKFFRDTTKGHALIMGRKTFESLGSPLPHRLNVVVTRGKDYTATGAIVTHSIEEALGVCKDHVKKHGNEIFIIGGGEIYKQSMETVDRIYMTRIHQSFEGDTEYPTINPNHFREVDRRERTLPVPFSFLIYDRT